MVTDRRDRADGRARLSRPWRPFFRLGLREWVGPTMRSVRSCASASRPTMCGGSCSRTSTPTTSAVSPTSRTTRSSRHGPRSRRRAGSWARRAASCRRSPDRFSTLVEFESARSAPSRPRAPHPGRRRPPPPHTGPHRRPPLGRRGGRRRAHLPRRRRLSYTEALMLDGRSDAGVAPEPSRAIETLTRIQRLAAERPTVYLPTHDPHPRPPRRSPEPRRRAAGTGEMTR